MRALIIEDEKNLARFLELELKDNGFSVEIAYDGDSGLQMALGQEFDIILLDWMLPRKEGIALLREFRHKKDTPVIIITAKDTVESEVEGFARGATDYLKKPFDNRQLIARIQAILRREKNTIKSTNTPLVFGTLILNCAKREVMQRGERIDLSKTEFDLLSFLIEAEGRVLTRDIILERCWGYDSEAETNVVDVYINHLRKKLKAPDLIRTVRGIGYAIDTP